MPKFKRLLFGSALLLTLIHPAFAQVNITTWQADLTHSGTNPNETILTPANVGAAGEFGLLFTQPMDGQTYGQVLYASNVNVSGTNHNIVFAATEHDSLYAFDADSNTGTNANPIWHDSFLPTGTEPVPQGNVGSGDISIELGITTTPVIDTSTSTIYIVSKVETTAARTDATGSYAAGTYQQYLHALDLATGNEKFGGPVLINPTFEGNSNVNGTEQTTTGVNNQTGSAYPAGVIPFNALHEHTRAAMIEYNGIIYISYASHSDTNPYHGEIIGYNASTLQVVRTFITTPNGSQGGIWGAGAGPTVDSNGNMFVSTANGNWDQTTSPYTTEADWSESFLKLPTSGTGAFSANFADPTTYFTPDNWATLNGGDLDIGSSGVCLLPTQTGGTHPHIMVGGGKGQVLYVVDRDNLGGENATDSAIQEIPEQGGDWLFVTPAYFNNYIYYSPSGGHLEQRAVGYNATTGGYIADPPTYQSPAQFGGKGSGVFISANGTTNGIVWILNGNLQAYNATNVSTGPIFSENATVPPNTGCQTTKFSLPMVANGKVYYTAFDTTNTGHLFVSGIIPPPVGTPAAPTNLTATATSLSQIVLNWTNNATNESGFIIERSTSSTGTFTQVGTTSVGVTTYTDTNLSPTTTYFYEVLATNANGNSFATNQASATTFPVYAPLGLVAYWNLDDTGDTAIDDTGNGHNGSVNGEVTSAASGYINGCFQFHGTGFAASNIAVPNSPTLQFAANQSFSVSAWVNPQNIHGVEQAIVAKSADQGNEYGIWINSNNQWVGRGNGGDIVGPTAVQGVWTHVALVQDGVAGTRKLYVNGVLSATGVAQAANGAGALWLGQQNLLLTQPDSFPGYLDEVRIYSRALSASDVVGLLSPPLLEAISSQTQGTSGTFGLVLAPLSTTVIEPRKGATVGTYNIVVSFAAPVSGVSATLGLQSGFTGSPVGSIQSVSYDVTGKIVTIVLTGVANDQALNIHLSGIVPGNGTADVPFNVLWGDANQDGAVNAHDVTIVANNHATSVTSTTAFYDFNCDGQINSSDDAIVTAAVGTSLGTEVDSNLALYGPATASSVNANSGNTANMAFDGNLNTRWESAWMSDPQSISVDLGQISTIHSITIVWENAAAATYDLQISNDDVNWTEVIAVGSGTAGAVQTYPANTVGGPVTFSGLNVTGRYVQMAGYTRVLAAYGYSMYEFEVFGVPGVITSGSGPVPVINSPLSLSGTEGAPFSYQITATNSPTSYAATGLPAGLSLNTATGVISGAPVSSGGNALSLTNTGWTSTIGLTATNANGTSTTSNLSLTIAANSDVNLALTGTATASSVNGGNVAANANDNNAGTRWESIQMVDPQYIIIDLGQIDTIHKVVLDWETAAGADYTIDTGNLATDGSGTIIWTNAVTVTNNPSVVPSIALTYGGMDIQARYVRMYGSTRASQYGYSLYEFQVWGVPGTTATPTFASQPTSQTVATGQPVTFTANPSGTGPFTYQWQYNGTNIAGATGSTYTINSVSSSNDGNYLVVVTNQEGSITSNYFTLSQPPTGPTPSPSDTPTLPPWALVVMALLFLGIGRRFLPVKRTG